MSTGCVQFNSCFSCWSLVSLLIQSYRCSLLSGKEAPARVSDRNQPSVFTQGRMRFNLCTKLKLYFFMKEKNALLVDTV